PVGLMAGQDLGAGEILQVLVLGDHIDQRDRALEVVLPVLEGLEDDQQLFVMGIIVQLRGGQSPRIVSDGLELRIGANNGQNAGDSIVRGIGLDHKQSVRNPMNRRRTGLDKSLLQEVESRATIISEFPRSVFAGKPFMDETMVEVCESEEGLDVLYFPRFWPIRDGLNFSADMESPLGERQKLRYSVEVVWNSHFSGLAKRLCFRRHWRTLQTCS
ncbi:hypothetical protein SCLCIDRAFT_110086, partial [Scleroderma citrinum Foug A]